MKLIKINLPRKETDYIVKENNKVRRISKLMIFNVILFLIVVTALGFIFFNKDNSNQNYNTGKINSSNADLTVTITPLMSISPTLIKTGSKIPVPTTKISQASPTPSDFGQMKVLVETTKSGTSWTSPISNSFDWDKNCNDASKKQTIKVNGNRIETIVDFTKANAQKTINDIQGYFQTPSWTIDPCNSADGNVKQIRGYVSTSTGLKVLVTYDSVYKDPANPDYPPSGTKTSESVTILYE